LKISQFLSQDGSQEQTRQLQDQQGFWRDAGHGQNMKRAGTTPVVVNQPSALSEAHAGRSRPFASTSLMCRSTLGFAG
jgi:hypothetical protein